MGGIMILFAFGMSLIINLVEKQVNPRADLDMEGNERRDHPAVEDAQ